MAAPGSNRTAIVIGAGIVGACTALELQRRGLRVTLLDREEPGTQCSFGNAGRIARALCAPRSLPGMAWKVPGMLRDPLHPLNVSPAHLARSLPWFWRFIRQGTPARAEAVADALDSLLRHADDAFEALLEAEDRRPLFRRDGSLYVYADAGKAAAARTSYGYAMRRGHAIEELDGDALRELEPALPASIRHGFYLTGEAYVVNPLRLTQTVVERFVEAGGVLARDEVRDLEGRQDATVRVATSDRHLISDTVVVAAGAWSGQIAERLGVELPVQAERGYHLLLPQSGIELTRPVHFGDRLVSLTPMEEGMRAVTGAEFAPVDSPANWHRTEAIVDALRHFYPGVGLEGMSRWMGPRPSMPDSMPAIGASASHPDILFACGHGQLGLTLSACTARLIGDLATGRSPAIDLAPFRPDRF